MALTFLVRHGDAGAFSHDPHLDAQRSLSVVGMDQAERLVLFFGSREVDDLVCSPIDRCRQTLAPTAAAKGLEPVLDATFADRSEPHDALSRLEALVAAGPDRTTVVCTHGTIIPEVIRLLRLRGMEVAGSLGCATASVWELHHDGERWTSGTYHPSQP